jgi:quercetin dioxygenase-like cupin family protein
MRVIKADEGASEERTGQPMLENQVWGRSLTRPEDNGNLTSTIVQFGVGARTRMHTHTMDQLLYIVSGIGKVGSADGERVVATGDVAIIPAGEPHWHGAGDTGSPMVHLMVMRADSVSEVLE